jgi:hypothetical protein
MNSHPTENVNFSPTWNAWFPVSMFWANEWKQGTHSPKNRKIE